MLNIAHRGASAAWPENTLAAFTHAMALGADGIELDIHCCRDGELVVIHDDTVDRTTSDRGRVADLTCAELKALRIEGTHAIPTLSEVFATLGKDAWYFLEVKHPDAALATAALMERCIAHGFAREKLWLISFHHAALAAVGAAHPELSLGMSFEQLDARSAAYAKALGARAMLPHYEAVTQEQVDAAHHHGLTLICWTVNDPTDIARLRSLGVDGIMSDYPERL